MFTTIYKTISEDEFAARSLSDYCDRATEFGQKMLLSFSEIIDSVDVEDLRSSISVDAICSNLGVDPQDSIRLNDGYVTYGNLFQLAINESISKVSTGEYVGTTITVANAAGEEISSVSYSDAIDQIKASMYATLSMGATSLASVEETVADRITVFNDKISTIFQNSYSDLASTAPYLRSIISDPNCSAGVAINKVVSLLGVTINDQDEVDEEALNASDILKYTGASPISILSCYSQLGVVGATISKGVKIIGKVLVGLTGLVVKGAKWIRDNVYGIATNPNDLAVINKKAKSFTIDQWRYNYTSSVIIDDGDDIYPLLSADNQFFSKYYGSWIKTDSVFAEKIVRINQVEALNDGRFKIYYEFQAKPKYVNWYSIYNAFLPYGNVVDVGNAGLKQLQINLSEITFSSSNFAELLYNLKSDPSLRDDTNCDEIHMFMGFYLGATLEMLSDLAASNDSDYMLPSIRMYEPTSWTAVNNSGSQFLVTNLSFVKVASGWFDYLNQFAGEIPSITNCIESSSASMVGGDPVSLPGPSSFASTSVRATLAYLSTADDDFIPYRDNVETFSSPHYMVKTDEQNISAWEKLLTIITVVVLVATVATIATVGIKVISNRLYASRNVFINQMNAKMWNGEKMTLLETLKYQRYSNKVSGQKLISKGLQSGYDLSLDDPSNDPNYVNFDRVINLIY